MTTQERLEKSRQELAEYQQIVQQDERIDMDFYQERLEQMRYMKQNNPDFNGVDLSGNMGGLGADPVVALVMGQPASAVWRRKPPRSLRSSPFPWRRSSSLRLKRPHPRRRRRPPRSSS